MQDFVSLILFWILPLGGTKNILFYFQYHDCIYTFFYKKYIIICWEDPFLRTDDQTCLIKHVANKISHKKESRTLSLWFGFEFFHRRFRPFRILFFILFSISWLYGYIQKIYYYLLGRSILEIHSWDLMIKQTC